MGELMKKIYLSLIALITSMMISVSAFAVDIIVVSHGQANDPFWSVAKNGVDKACKDMKVSCSYTAPATFDMVEMAKMINNAVSQKPKGIVITLPDAAALGKSVKNAIAAGIPVISMNSGSDDYMKLGISAHVGQTEFEAGVGGGQKMKAAGGKKALCVNHEVGNVALDRRCAGFKKGFGGSVEILGTSNDPTEIQKAVSAKLSGVDTILTLGAGLSGEAALKALEAAGKVGKVKLGTFDMSPGMLKAAAAGKVEFFNRPTTVSSRLFAYSHICSIYEIWNYACWCSYDWSWICYA
jgi:simple sugar transport system substrate-binding protein